MLYQTGHSTTIALTAPIADGSINVVDLALRDQTEDIARRCMRHAVESWDVRYVKIDSLVRGPVRAMVDGCRKDHRQLLVCPALPSAGRTVVDGVVLMDDAALDVSGAWRLELATPPASLGELLAPAATAWIGPTSTPPLRHDTILCADARTDDDLDRLADLVTRRMLLPIGAAGLFGALARRRAIVAGAEYHKPTDHDAPVDDHLGDGRDVRGVLVVVGTGSTRAHAQIAGLHRAGASVVELDPQSAAPSISATARSTICRGGSVVVHWRQSARTDPRRSAALSETLADIVADVAAADQRVSLVLTGGQTARSVLDRLHVTTLRPTSVVHHGAVVATTNQGRLVGIRPGSFGNGDSLVRMRNAVAWQP